MDDEPRETRQVRVVLDSSSRDIATHPLPSSYELRLQSDMFNVKSMRLAVAEVPFSAYLVGPPRSEVPLTLNNGSNVSAVLTIGDYASPAELAAELQSALCRAGDPVQAFTVAYLPRTDKYEIRSPSTFMLRTGGRSADSAALLLGFGTHCDYNANMTSDGSADYVVCAPFRRNFALDRYIIMRLSPNAELLTSPSQVIDRTFAIIPADKNQLKVSDDEDKFMKQWNPPLPRVSRIKVELLDAYGLPYDFQNHDNRIELVFEICTHKHKH